MNTQSQQQQQDSYRPPHSQPRQDTPLPPRQSHNGVYNGEYNHNIYETPRLYLNGTEAAVTPDTTDPDDFLEDMRSVVGDNFPSDVSEMTYGSEFRSLAASSTPYRNSGASSILRGPRSGRSFW